MNMTTTPKDTVEEAEKALSNYGKLQITEYLDCRCGFGEPRGDQCDCPWERKWSPNEAQEWLREALHATEARVRKEILTKDIEEMEGMKENLVVDNWEDGLPKNCNPRCHDSGKEQALADLITQKKEALQNS